ncbi:MAG: ATP-binding cassette domain-containing protein, partial [Polyangiales bacterium]
AGAREALRAGVGWLGHDLGLYADLTVGENLELFAGLSGQPTRAWARADADPLGVIALEGRRVRELSRGQRQRVALARVLLGEPRVILLDEPTTGLDVRATARLSTLIAELSLSGRCVVVVTHDQEFVKTLRSSSARVVEWTMHAGVLAREVADHEPSDLSV